jgi:hypothetical protein
MSDYLVKVFLVSVVICGILETCIGLFSWQKGTQTIDEQARRKRSHKHVLRGCLSTAINLVILILFMSKVVGARAALISLGCLLLLQEYLLAVWSKSVSKREGQHRSATDEEIRKIEEKERWEKIRRGGKRRFILTNTAGYALSALIPGVLIKVTSPEYFSMQLWTAIIIAAAIGGFTSTMRQWNSNERK